MKILIFNWRDMTHPWAGGAEMYLHEMAVRWIKEGHHVSWICEHYQSGKRREVRDGIHFLRPAGRYLIYLAAAILFVWKLRGKYDVIVDSENGIPFFTPLYSYRTPKILLIHHVHQEVFLTQLHFPFSIIAHLLEAKLMPLVYRKQVIVTVSPSSKNDIVKYKLTDIKKIVIIPNGVDLSLYKPGVKSSQPSICFVGRLREYKRVDILIAAMKFIKKKIPRVQLFILGDGVAKNNLHQLINKLHLSTCVKMIGHVTEKEKIDYLQKAWVAVNPSSMEGWGVTTIEANACGTPMVGSDINGLRDSIRHGRTGYLFPYGDSEACARAILLILTNTNRRNAFGRHGIEWAKKFSWDSSAATFLQFMKMYVKSGAKNRNTMKAFGYSNIFTY